MDRVDFLLIYFTRRTRVRAGIQCCCRSNVLSIMSSPSVGAAARMKYWVGAVAAGPICPPNRGSETTAEVWKQREPDSDLSPTVPLGPANGQ
jgi:hypothetical protein